MNATALVIMLATFGAEATVSEPLPREVRSFFERSDEVRDQRIRSLTSKLAALDEDIRAEPSAKQKAMIQKNRAQVQQSLADAKRGRHLAELPLPPFIDEMGVLPNGTLEKVIDDERAIARLHNGTIVVLTKTDTKRFRKGTVDFEDVWRSVPATPSARNAIENSDLGKSRFYMLEPVKKGDIERYRSQYEIEKTKPPVRPESTLRVNVADVEAVVPQQFRFRDGSQPNTRVLTVDNMEIKLATRDSQLERIIIRLQPTDKPLPRATLLTTLLGAACRDEEVAAKTTLWTSVALRMRVEEQKQAKELGTEFNNTELITRFGSIRVRSLPSDEGPLTYIVESTEDAAEKMPDSK